jgi:hypothetical protein
MECSNLTREGKFCIGFSCILASILLVACILIGLGTNAIEQEQGKSLMLAGGIFFLLFFISICTWCVACAHNNGNDSDMVLGPV